MKYKKGPIPQIAQCHPERRHYSRGMCKNCYTRRKRHPEVDYIAYPKELQHLKPPSSPKYIKKGRSNKYDFPLKLRTKQPRVYAQKRYYLKQYDLTEEEYSQLLENQNNKCAFPSCINQPKKRLGVDHDHKTGRRRALLCHKHNVGLGLFNDNIQELLDAIEYLQKFS